MFGIEPKTGNRSFLGTGKTVGFLNRLDMSFRRFSTTSGLHLQIWFPRKLHWTLIKPERLTSFKDIVSKHMHYTWSMILSSVISELAKFEPASIKVGKLPVVKAFIRCIVVVGGSAMNLYSLDEAGNLSNVFLIIGSRFSYGRGLRLSSLNTVKS